MYQNGRYRRYEMHKKLDGYLKRDPTCWTSWPCSGVVTIYMDWNWDKRRRGKCYCTFRRITCHMIFSLHRLFVHLLVPVRNAANVLPRHVRVVTNLRLTNSACWCFTARRYLQVYSMPGWCPRTTTLQTSGSQKNNPTFGVATTFWTLDRGNMLTFRHGLPAMQVDIEEEGWWP